MIDPFTAPALSPRTAPRRAVSLFELNCKVQEALRCTLPDTVWLAAEISELRVASNGHCYLEFVEKDPHSGSLVAKARGNIWRSTYLPVSAHFMRATGQPLAAGLKVLVQVKVNFHELYGYSLVVQDIDPAYTLGDLAVRRKEIIRQLQNDGVMDLNKELPIPHPIRRIAIISSPTAAGYGDFCNQLQQSGHIFETRLFPAAMQGEKVESSVIAALDQIASEAARWDVVALIRGGGAATDLGGFDSYLLAANVAQFPLPVLTGIGHERDETITDLVANKRFKTPTAVAAFLIESRESEAEALRDLARRLAQAADRRLQTESRKLENLTARLRTATVQLLAARNRQFDALAHRYDLAASRYCARQRENLLRTAARLDVLTRSHLLKEQHRLAALPPRLTLAADAFFKAQHQRLARAEQAARLADPARSLALGFTLTLKDGRPVCDASQLRAGDVLTTRFRTGEVQSVVK